jgi:hypothetical protein
MTNTREIILKLKKVKIEKGLSLDKILELMQKNNDYLAKSTLSRVFADGSEDKTFRYEETIRPIAKVLLDMETIEPNDSSDVQALKSIIRYKSRLIDELERQLENVNIKYLQDMENLRKQFKSDTELLRKQIDYKDIRMDKLMDSNMEKDALIKKLLDEKNELFEKIMKCSKCAENDI